jgi:hypothetical protein
MAKVATLPISLRLAKRDIEQLKARAATVSGTLTAVARELITIGLAGGDNKALADRLTHIERRLAALENLLHHASQRANGSRRSRAISVSSLMRWSVRSSQTKDRDDVEAKDPIFHIASNRYRCDSTD